MSGINKKNDNYEGETFTPDVDYIEEGDNESGMTGIVKLGIVFAGAAIAGGLAWIGKKLFDKHKEDTALRRPESNENPEGDVTPTEEDFEDDNDEE